ncbi:LOW QUALITY PROTEIN: immunoglobulin superfamily member 22 [Podargus strigoides]
MSDICLPKEVQNFTWKFNGKEWKWDGKYEIITSDNGLAHTKINSVLPRVPIQFISSLKNTQDKKKGKGVRECVLTSEDVTLKGTNKKNTFSDINIEIYKYAYYSALSSQMAPDGLPDSAAWKEASESRQNSPVIEESVLELFAAHSITVKTKHTASITVPFKAKPVLKVTWFKDGIEVTEEEKVVMKKASDALLTTKTCVRKDSGAVMLNLKNDCGSASDNPYLTFVNKLKPTQGKAEFLNTWGKCNMKWKAPKGNGGKQVIHFITKRQMTGKKSWIKVGVVESNYTTFTTEKVEQGKAYSKYVPSTLRGLSSPWKEKTFLLENLPEYITEDNSAKKPLRQVSQPQVVDVRKEDVTITWNFPAQDGGSPVQDYLIEKKEGSQQSLCPSHQGASPSGTRLKVNGFLEDTDELQVIAVNCAGPGLLSIPSTSVAKDPIGLGEHVLSICTIFLITLRAHVQRLEITALYSDRQAQACEYSSEPDQGDVLSGHIPEMGAEDTKKWAKCAPISSTTYTVGGLQETRMLLLNPSCE